MPNFFSSIMFMVVMNVRTAMISEAVSYTHLILDINMGCPVPKVVNNGEGSALLKNPNLIEEIVRKVSSARCV